MNNVWVRRRRVLRALVVMGLALTVAAAAKAGKAEDPFRTPRAQVIAMVKTIGVMPLTVADVVPNPESVAKRIHTRLLNSR